MNLSSATLRIRLITRRKIYFFPSLLQTDSFRPSPVRQHLFTKQVGKSSQVTIPESQEEKSCALLYLLSKASQWSGCCLFPWQTLLESCVEGPADDKSAHFTGACPYLVELGVTQEAPHRVVVDVTIPTYEQKDVTSYFSLVSGGEGGIGESTLKATNPASNCSLPRHWIPSRATWVAHSAE